MYYIVLNHSRPEIFEGGKLKSCVDYWTTQPDKAGKVRILGAGCGLKGFASLIEVDSEANFEKVLEDSPVNDIEDVNSYQVSLLAGTETETETEAKPGQAKFLIIAKPREPWPDTVDMPAASSHWQQLAHSKDAEVFSINDDGGFIAVVNVADHIELMGILMASPVNRWGEYEIIPLIEHEAESEILAKVGVI